MTTEDVQRIEKEINRPDDEITKNIIAFLKLFDPDYIIPFQNEQSRKPS